jgi:hypothetical protein
MEKLKFTANTEKQRTPEEIRTEGIARILETCSNNNKEIHEIEEALTVPRSKLSLIYDRATKKSRAYLGALVFAFAFQAHANQDQEPTSPSTPTGSTSYSQEQLASQSIDGIETLIEAARSADREVTISVLADRPSGTLVHHGQIHDTTEDINYELRGKIALSQERVAKILAKTTTRNTAVFVEGLTSEDSARLDTMQQVAELISISQNLADLEKAYHTAQDIAEGYRDQAIINKITGDVLVRLGFTEVSPLTYSNKTEDFVLVESGAIPQSVSYTVSNEVESAMGGAAELMDAKGYLNALPAETIEGMHRSAELRKELERKGEMLSEFFAPFAEDDAYYKDLSTSLSRISEESADELENAAVEDPCWSSEECREIVDEITEELIPAIKNETLDGREDTTMELVGEFAKTSDQQTFPLVYGAAHDFTRAVLKWNEEHPDQQFNLVTVKSKDELL